MFSMQKNPNKHNIVMIQYVMWNQINVIFQLLPFI